MIEKIFPLLPLFGIGVLLKHFKVLRKEDGKVISTLLMSAILPATIVGAVSSAPIEPRLLLLPVAGVVVDVFLLVAAYGLANLFDLHARTKGAFLIAFATLELGTIGYAIMAAAYGGSGLTYISLYDVGNGFFTFSVVPFLASLLGQSRERRKEMEALKQFARTPLLWSFAFGLLLAFLHIKIPMISQMLTIVSQGLLFLVMTLLALEFEPSKMSFTLPILMICLKTGIGIALGGLISLLFGFSGVERIAVILATSLPPSLLTIVMAKDNDLDAPFLAGMCSIALPVAIGIGSFLVMLT